MGKLDWLLGLGIIGIIAGYIFHPKVEEYIAPPEVPALPPEIYYAAPPVEVPYVAPLVPPPVEEYVYVPPVVAEVYVAPEWEYEYAGKRYATYEEALAQYEADGMTCPSPISVLKSSPITTVPCVARLEYVAPTPVVTTPEPHTIILTDPLGRPYPMAGYREPYGDYTEQICIMYDCTYVTLAQYRAMQQWWSACYYEPLPAGWVSP